MITLLADRPTPAYAAELEQFGRLAGLWETRISYYPADGSPSRHADGDWEFGYALDGRAVIDVWQVPGRRALAGAARSADQEHGLCVRIWDPRLRLWRFTFHGTARGDLVHMFAREIDDEIVMERADGAALVRWTFSDIRAESFEWRSERSGDGGRSWRLEQEVRSRRADTLPGAHRDELAGALLAPAPGASLGDEARLFDRFAGAWDCDYTNFAPDGGVLEHYPGEVTFGWILDGSAVQDVWGGDHGGKRSAGTSIRIFNAESGRWTVVWLHPASNTVITLEGGAVGERIVLDGAKPDGALRRWSFNDIEPDSFTWRGEHSDDGGRTWYLAAEYYLTRRGAEPSR